MLMARLVPPCQFCTGETERVPEQVLHELQVASLLVNDGRGQVAEGREPRSPVCASDSDAIQRWTQYVASEHIGIQRRFVFFGEDEIVWAVAKLLKWRGDRYRVIDTMSAFLCWRALFAWSLLQPILGLLLHSSAGNI
jgi:hypothetical protein